MTPPPAHLAAYVSLGAALGALARAGLVEVAAPHDAAMVLAINVLGALALGALPAVSPVRRSARLTALLGPGFLGGFTTVSTYALLAHGIGEDSLPLALAYVAATFAAALAAAATGRWLVRAGAR